MITAGSQIDSAFSAFGISAIAAAGLEICLGRRGNQSWRFYRDGSVS